MQTLNIQPIPRLDSTVNADHGCMPQLVSIPSRLPQSAVAGVRLLRGDVETEILATLARAGESRTVTQIHDEIDGGSDLIAFRTTRRAVNRLHASGFLDGAGRHAVRYGLNVEAVTRAIRCHSIYVTTGKVRC